jgi:hydrogenase maturation protein HypF
VDTLDLEARRWTLTGRVQGVGFRPFVYRLATALGLSGWVLNRTGLVVVHAQGTPQALATFGTALVARAPPLARPVVQSCHGADWEDLTSFAIRASEDAGPACIHVPPDLFACDECVTELFG